MIITGLIPRVQWEMPRAVSSAVMSSRPCESQTTEKRSKISPDKPIIEERKNSLVPMPADRDVCSDAKATAKHPLHNVVLVTSPDHDDVSDVLEELEDLWEALQKRATHSWTTHEQ